MTNDGIVGVALLLAVGVAVVVGLLLLLREFWTWWWKQSEQVRLLRSIDTQLAELVALNRPRAAPQAPLRPAPLPIGPVSLPPHPTRVRRPHAGAAAP